MYYTKGFLLMTISVIIFDITLSVKASKDVEILNIDARNLSEKELKSHYNSIINYLENYVESVHRNYYPLCEDESYLDLKDKDSTEYKNFARYFDVKVPKSYTYDYGIKRINPVNKINFQYQLVEKSLIWFLLLAFCVFMFFWCFLEIFIVKCRLCDICYSNEKTLKARRYAMAIISVVITIFTVIYCSASLNKAVATFSKRSDCAFKWSIYNQLDHWDKRASTEHKIGSKKNLKSINLAANKPQNSGKTQSNKKTQSTSHIKWAGTNYMLYLLKNHTLSDEYYKTNFTGKMPHIDSHSENEEKYVQKLRNIQQLVSKQYFRLPYTEYSAIYTSPIQPNLYTKARSEKYPGFMYQIDKYAKIYMSWLKKIYYFQTEFKEYQKHVDNNADLL